MIQFVVGGGTKSVATVSNVTFYGISIWGI
jgi:hypothetical protein